MQGWFAWETSCYSIKRDQRENKQRVLVRKLQKNDNKTNKAEQKDVEKQRKKEIINTTESSFIDLPFLDYS